jgi:hypothetical protein
VIDALSQEFPVLGVMQERAGTSPVEDTVSETFCPRLGRKKGC